MITSFLRHKEIKINIKAMMSRGRFNYKLFGAYFQDGDYFGCVNF